MKFSSLPGNSSKSWFSVILFKNATITTPMNDLPIIRNLSRLLSWPLRDLSWSFLCNCDKLKTIRSFPSTTGSLVPSIILWLYSPRCGTVVKNNKNPVFSILESEWNVIRVWYPVTVIWLSRCSPQITPNILPFSLVMVKLSYLTKQMLLEKIHGLKFDSGMLKAIAGLPPALSSLVP